MSDCRDCCARHDGADAPALPARRAFVGRAIPSVLLALAGLAGLPRDLAAARGETGPAFSPDELTYPIPERDGVVIDRDNAVIVVRRGGRVFAFALACPHEQEALRWRQADGRFQCPRHESKYQIDGTLISGRARRSMDRFALRRDGDTIVVDPERLYRSDRQPDEWQRAVVML